MIKINAKGFKKNQLNKQNKWEMDFKVWSKMYKEKKFRFPVPNE